MRPTNPRQIQAQGQRDFELLADLLGVPLTGDFRTDRAAVDRVLAGGRPGSGLLLGEHPEGRASTLDEIVIRYQDGEISNEYDLPEASSSPSLTWFDEVDRREYGREGFHPSAASYEFTNLWYQLFGEELSLRGMTQWAVEHGGLRWEYHEGEVVHSEVEDAAALAYARYQEAYQAITSGYVPVIPEPEAEKDPNEPAEADFTTDDLWAMLSEDGPATDPEVEPEGGEPETVSVESFPHAFVVAIENDKLTHFFICNNLVNGVCQDPHASIVYAKQGTRQGSCPYPDQLSGMSRMGAYRITDGKNSTKTTMLSFKGLMSGDTFTAAAMGGSKLELILHDDTPGIYLDGSWVSEVEFKGAKMAVLPVEWIDDRNGWCGEVVWDFTGDALYFTPKDKEWAELMAREWTA